MKILYIENVATVNATSFYNAALIAAHKLGWQFHLAYNCLDYSELKIAELQKQMGLHFHQIQFYRNPLHVKNTVAYKQLCELLQKERFDIIHCNTPIGGVLGRLVARKYGVKHVLYQAHGFHFYDGASVVNWAIYYPIEKILAYWTETIVTINHEDFERAQKKLHPKKEIRYIPGIGLDTNAFSVNTENREAMRSKLGIANNDIVLLSVGRLEPNKNVQTLIKAVADIQDKKVKMLICGDGELRTTLQETVQREGLSERIIFLGNRNDMADIYSAVDCFVLASYRQGLSRSIMEAMACGLPCIVSRIRGNVDLVDEDGGYLCLPNDYKAYARCIETMAQSSTTRCVYGRHNRTKVQSFSLAKVSSELMQLYKSIVFEVRFNEY